MRLGSLAKALPCILVFCGNSVTPSLQNSRLRTRMSSSGTLPWAALCACPGDARTLKASVNSGVGCEVLMLHNMSTMQPGALDHLQRLSLFVRRSAQILVDITAILQATLCERQQEARKDPGPSALCIPSCMLKRLTQRYRAITDVLETKACDT